MCLVMSDTQQFHLQEGNDDLDDKCLISKIVLSSLKIAF